MDPESGLKPVLRALARSGKSRLKVYPTNDTVPRNFMRDR